MVEVLLLQTICLYERDAFATIDCPMMVTSLSNFMALQYKQKDTTASKQASKDD